VEGIALATQLSPVLRTSALQLLLMLWQLLLMLWQLLLMLWQLVCCRTLEGNAGHLDSDAVHQTVLIHRLRDENTIVW